MEYEFKGKNTNKKREFNKYDGHSNPPEWKPYRKDRNSRFEDLLENFLKESKDKQKHVKTEFIKERKNKVNKNKDKDIGDDK